MEYFTIRGDKLRYFAFTELHNKDTLHNNIIKQSSHLGVGRKVCSHLHNFIIIVAIVYIIVFSNIDVVSKRNEWKKGPTETNEGDRVFQITYFMCGNYPRPAAGSHTELPRAAEAQRQAEAEAQMRARIEQEMRAEQHGQLRRQQEQQQQQQRQQQEQLRVLLYAYVLCGFTVLKYIISLLKYL